MKNNTLFLFTATFPFGKAESFLETEILFLSDKFEKIVIIPLSGQTQKIRNVPKNCIVEKPIITSRRIQYFKGLFFPLTLSIFIGYFFRNRIYSNNRKLKTWIIGYVMANNLLSSKTIKSIFKDLKSNDVCYFYWGKGSNILSYFYRGKAIFVSRFHGEWDLWEESSGGCVPLRTDVAKSLDKAVFISKKGESYFKERYPYAETCVFPLGSKDYGLQLEKLNDNVVRVVSCSTVYPLKRVPLIFEALNSMTGIKIEWTHLGGGSHFQELKEIVEKETKSHLSVNLVGMVSHDEVMNYYKEHHFDLFINMSTSEGVPVSIMEAMSFGIPILATDVGSTAEEVPKQVGELLSPNPSIEEIIAKIRLILSSNYSPRKFWNENYNADKNYSEFANMLYNLSNNAKLSI